MSEASLIKVCESADFQHVIRVFNSNIKGSLRVGFALRGVRGIGRRFAHVILKKARIDPLKRAGELKPDEVDKITDIVNNPTSHGIPKWLLNRKKDPKEGTYSQLVSNNWDTKLREDLEKMRKIKLHKGMRHIWGLKVRGQHTCATGRLGATMGYIKTKK